jgi:chromosome segregation ATPase
MIKDMEREPSNRDLLNAIGSLEGRFDSLEGKFGSLDAKVGSLDAKVGSLEGRFDSTDAKVGSLQEEVRENTEAIHDLATHMDERFATVDGRLNKIEATMVTKDELDSRLNKLEAKMVTKDYLDVKLADQGAEFGEYIRKTNGKIGMLAGELVKAGSLSAKAAKAVTSAEPFVRG